jgi:hypothetical protein
MKKTNKLTKLLAVLLIIALAALTMVALSGCSGCNGDTPPNGYGGYEVGTFVHHPLGGELYHTLELNEDLSFSLTMADLVSSGRYSLEYRALTLAVATEGLTGIYVNIYGTVSADYNYIMLTMSGVTMRFDRLRNFTVSFNTHGGSPVEGLEVRFNHALTAPNNPTKEGYLFAGWHTNATWATPWVFAPALNPTRVTSNTTLHARFLRQLDPSLEHTINFSWNWPTGVAAPTGFETNPASLQTASHFLSAAQLPSAPSLTGFDFYGWWTSATNSGAALTAPHNPTAPFAAPTTLFARWEAQVAPGMPRAPVVTATNVSGVTTGFTWLAQAGASFNVQITGPAGFTPIDTTVNANVFLLPADSQFADLPAGTFTVSVTATIGANTSAAGTLSYVNRPLLPVVTFGAHPDSVTSAVFTGVPNATRYYVRIYCATFTGGWPANNAWHLLDNTLVDFTTHTMRAQGIYFYVRAAADNFVTSTSQRFVLNRTLAALPQAGLVVTDNQEEQTLTLAEVANATSFRVEINGGEGNSLTTTLLASARTLDLSGFDIVAAGLTISVTPLSQWFNSPAATVYTWHRTSLTRPTFAEGEAVFTTNPLGGGTFTWQAVPHATRYEVQFGPAGNPTTHIVTTTYFTFDQDVSAGVVYAFRVRALGPEGGSLQPSLWTAAYELTAQFTGLSYNNRTVSWNAMQGVSGFAVQVGAGAIVEVTGTSVEIEFATPGYIAVRIAYVTLGGVRSEWHTLTLFVYYVVFNSNLPADEVIAPIPNQFYVAGDRVNFPPNPRVIGRDFQFWNSNSLGTGINFSQIDTTPEGFIASGNLTMYAHWVARTTDLNFVLDDVELNGNFPATFYLDGANAGEPIAARNFTFGVPFSMPVPKITNAAGEHLVYDVRLFLGWFTEPNGGGVRLTDNNGTSVHHADRANSAPTITPTLRVEVKGLYYVFPYFATVFSFTWQDLPAPQISGYTVGIANRINFNRYVGVLTIPSAREGRPVVRLQPGAGANTFRDMPAITRIYLPDTLVDIPDNLFPNSPNISYVGVYGNSLVARFISHDGILYSIRDENQVLSPIRPEFFPLSLGGVITILDGVQYIREDLFRNNQLLERLYLPASVLTIGRSAFENTRMIEYVCFGGSDSQLTTIMPRAFAFSGIESITIPGTVRDTLNSEGQLVMGIGYAAFNGFRHNTVNPNDRLAAGTSSNNGGTLSRLHTINWASGTQPLSLQGRPEGITDTSDVAHGAMNGAFLMDTFSGVLVDEIVVPNRITYVGNNVLRLAGIPNYTYETAGIAPGSIITRTVRRVNISFEPESTTNPLNIPLRLGSFDGSAGTVGSPFGRSFGSPSVFNTVNTIVIPARTTYIAAGAFSFVRDHFSSITFETGGTEDLVIGDNAFRFTGARDNYMPVIQIPARTTQIGAGAFAYRHDITNITFEQGGNRPLTIGARAFALDNNLRHSNHALYRCTVIVPSRVTSIGSEAFFNNFGLENVTFETDLADNSPLPLTFGARVFGHQPPVVGGPSARLTSIELPSRTYSVHSEAFARTGSLESILVSQGYGPNGGARNYSDINGLLFNEAETELVFWPRGRHVSNVSFPSTTTTIASHAFADHHFLGSILTIPYHITLIGYNSFFNTRFNEIQFSASAQPLTIADATGANGAFRNNPNLARIRFLEDSYVRYIG